MACWWRSRAVLISVSLIASAASAAGPATRPADPLQYRLSVGQELTYTTRATVKPDQFGQSGTGTTTFRVVGRTSDGLGWHLVSRHVDGKDGPANMAAFDLWPDGRQQAGPTGTGMPASPVNLFPPLPSAGSTEAWEVATPDGKRVYHTAPATQPTTAQFAAEEQSPMNAIYLLKQAEADTFDVARGLLTHAEGTSSQDYGFHIRQTWTRDLTGDAVRPADEAAKYGEQVVAALSAVQRYHEGMRAAAAAVDPAVPARAALDGLTAARTQVSDPDLTAMLDRPIHQHGEYVKELASEKTSRGELVGHPAPPFDLVDLDGKRHALADLHGQVVVLDFWYRGCGWCMKAMPQVKQLADEYKGRPVAFFGMNHDSKAEDAKLVADLFALPYPTLLMSTAHTGAPTSRPTGANVDYHVQGYPTTVVIGPDGVIREVEVGYSPTLHDSLKHAIDGALPDAPRASVR